MELDCLAEPPDVTLCADARYLGDAYVYLLGLYLGDGMLTAVPRRVWRLRVVLDLRYPAIIERCLWAIEEVAGRPGGRAKKIGCVEIYSNWKHWRCMFPQHAPGRKHERWIRLEPWQLTLVRAYPHEFLRGLVHSDGCRVINRVRRPTLGGLKEYEYVRYFFVNASPDIRQLFVLGCNLIGVDCRRTTERVLSVARRDSVGVLESFIGPKC